MALTEDEELELLELRRRRAMSAGTPPPTTGRSIPDPISMGKMAALGARAIAPEVPTPGLPDALVNASIAGSKRLAPASAATLTPASVVPPLDFNLSNVLKKTAMSTARSMVPVPLSGSEAMQILKPLPGQFGIPGLVESAAASLENSVNASAPKFVDKYVEHHPLSGLVPSTMEKTKPFLVEAIKMHSGQLRPSEQAMNIGAEGALGAAGAALGKLGTKAAVEGGRIALGIPEEATKTAIDNPKVLEEGYSNPEKVSEIARGFKRGIEGMKQKASNMYKSTLEKLGAGKGSAKKLTAIKDVMQPLEDIQKDLGIKKVVKGRTVKIVGERGSKQKIGNEEIGKFTELYKKISQDAKKGKVNAIDLHNERELIDSYSEHANTSPLLKGKLRQARKAIDNIIRDKHPEIKAADAEYVKLIRTAKTLERRTGIKPGEYSPITELSESKIGSASKGFFDKGRQSHTKAFKDIAGKMGRPGLANEMASIAAAEKLDPGALLNAFALSPSSVGKRILRTGIKAGTSLAEKFKATRQILATFIPKGND